MSDRIDHATVLRVAADLCDADGDEHIGRDINAAADYIDQLIREMDELRGSKDQLMVALEAVARLKAENERLRDVLVSCHQIFSHPGFTDRAGIGERVASILASKEQES